MTKDYWEKMKILVERVFSFHPYACDYLYSMVVGKKEFVQTGDVSVQTLQVSISISC